MRIFTVFLVLFYLAAQARIIQTNQIEEVLCHVDAKTWVFFDIDETLLISEVLFGRSDYYIHQLNALKKSGLEEERAHEICRSHWRAIQKHYPVRPMEAAMKEVVSTVQKTAAFTMALTARGPHAKEITHDQLRSLEMDFRASSPEKIAIELPFQNSYENGIWFIERNPKGKSILKWLEALKSHPEKIVFVDDRLHHLENMEESLSHLQVEYTGIHYARVHETPFDPQLASIEAHSFFNR
jgi:Protein of unknown function (DUF2608)